MSIPSVLSCVLPLNPQNSEQVILRAVQAISALPAIYHNLSIDEITLLVKHSLWRMCVGQQQSLEYVSGKKLLLPRDLLIDLQKARVTIISKKFGDMYTSVEGYKVCRGIDLSLRTTGISVEVVKCYIHKYEKSTSLQAGFDLTFSYADRAFVEAIEDEFPLSKTVMPKVESHCQLFGLEDDCTICNACPILKPAELDVSRSTELD